MNIRDPKYQIFALNVATLALHNEQDSVLFLAKDQVLPYALEAYISKAIAIGVSQDHIDKMSQLLDDVKNYQADNGSKLPDTLIDGEHCEVPIFDNRDVATLADAIDDIGNRLMNAKLEIINALPDSLVTVVPDESTGGTKKQADVLNPLNSVINDLFTITRILNTMHK